MKLLAAGAATEFVIMRILQALRQESKKCLDGWVGKVGAVKSTWLPQTTGMALKVHRQPVAISCT
jgi:hypothetical protein